MTAPDLTGSGIGFIRPRASRIAGGFGPVLASEDTTGKLSPAHRSVPVETDGAFVFRGLPPGQFNLSISLEQPPTAQNQQAIPLDHTSMSFVIPKDAGAHFQLGDVGWTN